MFESRRVSIFAPDGRFIRNFNMDNSLSSAVFNDSDQLVVAENSKVAVYTLGE